MVVCLPYFFVKKQVRRSIRDHVIRKHNENMLVERQLEEPGFEHRADGKIDLLILKLRAQSVDFVLGFRLARRSRASHDVQLCRFSATR